MSKKEQRKFIALIRLPDGSMKNVVIHFRARPGSTLEDGSKVVKIQ